MKEKESFKRKLDLLCAIPRLPRKISTEDLQKKLQTLGYRISLRSIQRDLNTLSSAYPVQGDNAKPQGWGWLAEAPALVMPAIAAHSALGLSMIQSQIQDVLPSAVKSYLDPWVALARDSMKTQKEHLRSRRISDCFRVLPRSMPFKAPKIRADVHQAVVDALLSGRQLELRYRAQSSGATKSYVAHPLAIVVVDVSAYLVCTINDYLEPRTLAMHRILVAKCSTDIAKVPAGFSLDGYIAEDHFGVRFSDQQLRLQVRLKKIWANLLAEAPVADDQTVSDDADGWSVVNATVADTIQLRRWLYGYGADVEVLRPPSLRQEFAAAVTAAAQFYRD